MVSRRSPRWTIWPPPTARSTTCTCFARNRADLVKDFPRLRDKLAPGGSLWISWIKQSAIRGGGGLPGDLNENAIRRMALSSGLVDVKVAALDAEWSALKLVWRRH